MHVTKQQTGSVIRLALHGDLDIATIGEVRDTVVTALAEHAPSVIVLDMRLVRLIDSTAIGELVGCHRAAAVAGATLMLENVAPLPYRQLWATGLLGLFGLTNIPRPAPATGR